MKIKSRVFNRAYLKYIDAEHQTQIFFGGSSSGKSVFLAQRTILRVCKGHNYLICRNVSATIKKSVFNEITKVINKFKLSEIFNINKSDLVITCLANNRQILFSGLDDPEKIKSITPIHGVITDIWVEEATETEYRAVKQLYKRLRGKSRIKKTLTLSFNPILKTHWIYKEYFHSWNDNDKLYEDENLLILHTTYKDNKFLTEEDIKLLENETDKYFYEVYTLGKWGIIGAVIYKDWEIKDLKEIRKVADYIFTGLDFGYAESPSAFIFTHYDKKRKIIYILDEIYTYGSDNEELAELIKTILKKMPVFCDSAEPKSINELKKYNINAYHAKKGPDSLNYGIKFLQKHKIIIDVSCKNFKDEISKYKWKEDREGNIFPIPIKKDDHGLDALRYAYSMEMSESEAIIF